MKNSIVNSRVYSVLEDYFRTTFTEDGHFETYDEIKRQTGVDIRATKSQRHYNIFAQLRDNLRLDDIPLMLEVRRGEGVERIRIGIGAYVKGYSDLDRIGRKSDKMLALAQVGRIHSVDDEEAFQNQTMARIYSHIKLRTLRQSVRDEFVVVSNGHTPTRPFVSLRDLSKLSLGGN